MLQETNFILLFESNIVFKHALRSSIVLVPLFFPLQAPFLL